jgi:hypothetical protein
MPTVDEFLNPKSMVAPGIAGATTMAITNAVALNFDLSRPWLGLIVSGLFAAAAVAYAQLRLTEKFFFGALNTLIIFSVALGTNNFGTATLKNSQASLGSTPIDWVIRSAAAQPAGIPQGALIKGSGPSLYLIDQGKRRLVPDQKTRETAGLENTPVTTVTDEQLNAIPQGPAVASRRFFSTWIQ